MQVKEALMFMGLDEGVTGDEVKVAYREMSQILHPDKFANNPKLQERATEQFKHLNDARDTLMAAIGADGCVSVGNFRAAAYTGSGKRAAADGGVAGSDGTAGTGQSARSASECSEGELRARLRGIAAAREELVAYRDVQVDTRKRGLMIAAVGILLLFVGRRFPVFIAFGSAGLVWGIVSTANAHMSIEALTSKLDELEQQRRLCVEALGKL